MWCQFSCKSKQELVFCFRSSYAVVLLKREYNDILGQHLQTFVQLKDNEYGVLRCCKINYFIASFHMVTQMVQNSAFFNIYVQSYLIYVQSHLICIQFRLIYFQSFYLYSVFLFIFNRLICIQSLYLYSVMYIFSDTLFMFSLILFVFSQILYVFNLIVYIFSQLFSEVATRERDSNTGAFL